MFIILLWAFIIIMIVLVRSQLISRIVLYLFISGLFVYVRMHMFTRTCARVGVRKNECARVRTCVSAFVRASVRFDAFIGARAHRCRSRLRLCARVPPLMRAVTTLLSARPGKYSYPRRSPAHNARHTSQTPLRRPPPPDVTDARRIPSPPAARCIRARSAY